MKILVRTLMDGNYIRTVMDAHERWVNVRWTKGGRWVDDGWTMGGRWVEDGWKMCGKWVGSGWTVGGRWVDAQPKFKDAGKIGNATVTRR